MIFKTAPNGTPLPSKVNLRFGDALTVFITDDDGNTLVADSIYLTEREPSSGSYGGSLNTVGPPNTLGNDPSAVTESALGGATTWPSAFATISDSKVTYYAPAKANSTGSVRAKLVAVSGAQQRELLIDVN